MTRRRVLQAAAAGLVLPALFHTVSAAYPVQGQTLRLVVPFAAGGGTDTVVRLFAEQIAALWQASIIIENRPGGGTVIGTQSVLHGPSDGSTLLAVSNSFLVAPLLTDKPLYDPLRDFQPVGLMAVSPHVLVVHASVPASNLQEFIQWLKRNGQSATYASFGRGSSNFLGFEEMKSRLGLEAVHIPYGGAAPAMKDLLGGHVLMMLADTQIMAEQFKAGSLKAIGVASSARLASLPDIPTLAEQGLDNFVSRSFFGLVARAGTDPAIVRQWNLALAEAQSHPVLRDKLEAHSVMLRNLSVPEFEAMLREEGAASAAILARTAKP